MSIQAILCPLFIEVLLTFVLLIRMGVLRNADLKGGAVKPDDVALRQLNWPKRTQQAANSFSSQFELPVLFYVLTILEIVTRSADLAFVVLAWVFVISRIPHAYIHSTSNIVFLRGKIFAIGVLALIAMWVIFMIRILFGPL